ncbi:hypothetical protein QBC32DRAFT_81782 [Pseudoneurospora amorphoporcata]|uniref:Uncharacterized protein n=1 Tax=Pseudoneurospora amorphoporcata TaxID=241081 RepID=A0AAN6SC55_9PEZI|nr:hypothetical protein QBC32DRAFT_81782 [Pseudoneurospora amorphoporcata]
MEALSITPTKQTTPTRPNTPTQPNTPAQPSALPPRPATLPLRPPMPDSALGFRSGTNATYTVVQQAQAGEVESNRPRPHGASGRHRTSAPHHYSHRHNHGAASHHHTCTNARNRHSRLPALTAVTRTTLDHPLSQRDRNRMRLEQMRESRIELLTRLRVLEAQIEVQQRLSAAQDRQGLLANIGQVASSLMRGEALQALAGGRFEDKDEDAMEE